MIYHLQVGTTKSVPTDDELKAVAEEFKKPMPVFTVPVKITEIEGLMKFGISPGRLLIHMGSAGWDPTEPEIEKIRAQFEVAHNDLNDAVVATRVGVRVVHNSYQLGEQQ